MVLGKKGGYFRLGMGPKFAPKRRAENYLQYHSRLIVSYGSNT